MRLKMRFSPILPLLLVASAGLSACNSSIDSIATLNALPFGGTNQANIAAMVANPADLAHGQGAGPALGKTAEAPIDRLQTDHDKSLLSPGKGATSGGTGG
jgi:type IV pilus biogenesis protein CpaD/CtpE